MIPRSSLSAVSSVRALPFSIPWCCSHNSSMASSSEVYWVGGQAGLGAFSKFIWQLQLSLSSEHLRVMMSHVTVKSALINVLIVPYHPRLLKGDNE